MLNMQTIIITEDNAINPCDFKLKEPGKNKQCINIIYIF